MAAALSERQPPWWALPGELAVLAGARAGRRTARDWLVDAVLFLLSGLVWAAMLPVTVVQPDAEYLATVPDVFVVLDPWVGAGACVSLWWRRRYPVLLAVLMVPVLSVAGTALGAVLVAVFTAAVHRGWLPATAVSGAQLVQVVPFALQYQPAGQSPLLYSVHSALLFLLPVVAGVGVRFRRQLVANLRREAERQRAEQDHRMREARRAEREQIAREMHDVLAHRLSMLSVHAGALSYRIRQARQAAAPALTPAEVADEAELIRGSAQRALSDLSEVVSVLRVGDHLGESRAAPAPRLAQLPQLVAEAQAAGQEVTLAWSPPPTGGGGPGGPAAGDAQVDGPDPPARTQHTVYRIVQEGLTNARKHAPSSAVTIRVEIAAAEAVTVTVQNPVPAGGCAAAGGGAGLTGLAERVALHDGTLEHHLTGDVFTLTARLPWQP